MSAGICWLGKRKTRVLSIYWLDVRNSVSMSVCWQFGEVGVSFAS